MSVPAYEVMFGKLPRHSLFEDLLRGEHDLKVYAEAAGRSSR
jgi:hypothetical protein